MRFLWPDVLWFLLLVPALIAAYVVMLRRRKNLAVRYASLTLVRDSIGAGQRVRRHTVDLSRNWTSDLNVTIDSGAADLIVRLPKDVGVRVEVDRGPTVIDAPNLSQDGNVYTNDAYGASDVTLQIKMQSGIGQIKLEVEE